MNKVYSKIFPFWILILILIALCACSDVSEDLTQQYEDSVLVRIPQFNFETAANVTSIDLYQFSDGTFVRKVSVDPSKENTVEFARKPGTTFYALAGYTIEGSQQHAENDFSVTSIPMPKNAHSAPIFFSSITALPEGATRLDIELRRGVSRLDINNSDPDLKIEKVSISGAASSSQLFATDGRTLDQTWSYFYRQFESGISGIEERAFVLFETSTPIAVTISGRRNGKCIEITTHTPAIVRDRIYLIDINSTGAGASKERKFQDEESDSNDDDSPTVSIKVTDWQEGDVKTASVVYGETAIDPSRSYIPSGAKLIREENKVSVPADGVEGMMLAFLTMAPLTLGSVVSDSEGVRVTPLAPKESENGYVSVFRVDVAKQAKGAGHYHATVFFKGSSQFFINIYVDPSPYQVPTVHIAGHDWMCFNAVSQDPEEQIYLPKGMTVEKMYADRFAECIGNQFQFGRPYPFSPWKAYDPNMFAGQPRNSTWTSAASMPLPKGFHVASMDEWHDLLPHGVVIPSSYKTPTGDSIRVTIVTLPGTLDGTPSALTNAQNFRKRCVLFESIITGVKLYLPIAGLKTNTSVEIPSHPNFRFDTKSGYWMREDQNVLYLDYGYMSDGKEGVKFDHQRANADCFVMVRGIKD